MEWLPLFLWAVNSAKKHTIPYDQSKLFIKFDFQGRRVPDALFQLRRPSRNRSTISI